MGQSTPYRMDNPEYYNSRAEEARNLAKQMKDELSRVTMFAVAKDYERLAEQAKARRNQNGKS